VSLTEEMKAVARRAKLASNKGARLATPDKNRALLAIADGILNGRDALVAANRLDVEAAEKSGLAPAMVDRLKLSPKVLETMVKGLREVAALPDPVGTVSRQWVRPNGMRVGKMRIPLGVILIIYESRPNVTVDAAALCLKAGNAVILRGGKEAIHSNQALGEIIRAALQAANLPTDLVQVLQTTDRTAMEELLKLDEEIDLVIPRGGEALIRYVAEKSRIPVIKHYKGVCHVYVDEFADVRMADDIVFNGKVQRPGVCNALETLLVNEKIAAKFLPVAAKRLHEAGVELRVCPETAKHLGGVPSKPATEDDWYAEYLELILAVRVVPSLEAAIEHIDTYGSHHTETIVTESYSRSQKFLRDVNSSCVFLNASTRFSDGFELGLGAEIGISTTKLHAYGPMGVEELTTEKFFIYGDGQIRA